MKHYIHHWNQPLEEIHPTKYTAEGYLNPDRGNVRVGNREIKWYNMFNKH